MEDTTQLTSLGGAHPNKNDVNDTSDDTYQQALWINLKILNLLIGSISFFLGVIGNGLVIFITGFHMKRTVNTIWFLNLAIADFTFTFFLPLSITYVAMDFRWPFGNVMCKVNSTLAFINLCASVYILMIISIDRCISVFAPVWAQNHRNPHNASFVALGVWILALVLSVPNFYFREYVQNVTFSNCRYGHNENQARGIYHDMVISRFIFAFVIPFLVIIICYGAIVVRLRRNRLVQSSKPFKVITAVIVAFFVCWFPFHVFSFLEVQAYGFPTRHRAYRIGTSLSLSLAFFNSCLNPILYVFMGHNFKESLKSSIHLVFERVFTEEE